MLEASKAFLFISIIILLIAFFILILLKIDNGFIIRKLEERKDRKRQTKYEKNSE